MKKITFYIFLFLILTQQLNSQSLTQNIRGRVIDKDSKDPLEWVSMVIVNSKPSIGTTTDGEGIFRFDELEVGRYSIELYYMGYESKTVSNILIGAGKEVVLEIEMTESLVKLDEVIISAERQNGEVINKMAAVSARSFSVEETKRYAGSFNDPSRMASSYAGVSGSPEGDNDIVIRGNSPRGLLWRLEGIEIPNPNHFAEEGATGGPISILNGNVLSDSDFFTGAFPSEYGNAYSGVFDIKLRKGNNEKREYSFQAGVLGLDASMEGPFKKGSSASYLVNYRYSSLSLLNAMGIKIAGDAVPKFQDASFNLSFPTLKYGTFNLFGVGGISNINEGDTSYTNDFATGMGVIGLGHTYFLNKNTYIRTVLAVTGSSNKWKYNEPDTSDTFILKAREDFVYVNGRAAVTLNKKLDARNAMQLGLIYSRLTYDLESANYDNDLDRLVVDINDKGATDQLQGFLSWKYRVNDKLTIYPGVHYLRLFLNDNYSIEPRLGLKWQVAPNQSVNAGVGMHSKVETISNYLAQHTYPEGGVVQHNKDLGFTKARHYVLGYENMLSKNLMLRLELYYQQLYAVPIEDSANSTFSALNYTYGYTTRPLANKGTGTNYGIDLTLEKFFSNNYYFLATASLYESKYVAGDGIERGTRFNGSYVVNALGGKEFNIGRGTKARVFSVSAKGSWAGGRRYTPIDLDESREKGYTVRDESRAFEEQADAFMRFDLKLALRRDKKKTTRVWELDIQNVTNRLNMAGDYYDSSKDEIVTYTQLGFLPTLSYRIEF